MQHNADACYGFDPLKSNGPLTLGKIPRTRLRKVIWLAVLLVIIVPIRMADTGSMIREPREIASTPQAYSNGISQSPVLGAQPLIVIPVKFPDKSETKTIDYISKMVFSKMNEDRLYVDVKSP